MCAYNRINGVWACEQPDTLKTMLKGRFNFSGFVVSDWGACHSSAAALNAGLDIEMPHSQYFNEAALSAALDSKQITFAQIDDSCTRILSGWYALPPSKRFPCNGGICIRNNVSTASHKALARKVSAQSTVLLKNNGLLPLGEGRRPGRSLTVALIGPDAKTPYTAGGGSGHVLDSNVAVSPLMGFLARTNEQFQVTYEPGCDARGLPDLPAVAAAAAAADVAIVFVSATSHEGRDRPNLNLSVVGCSAGHSFPQEELIHATVAAQPQTVVSMAVPGLSVNSAFT